MFQNEFNSRKNTYVFVGGFHLGIPLVFSSDNNSKGWQNFKSKLENEFSKTNDLFEIVFEEYESETKFPLGNPIFLKHKKFDEIINLREFFRKEGRPIDNLDILIDNRIWILPTGIVLIIGSLSIDQDLISIAEFEDKIIENHYAELSLLFLDIAEIIYSILPHDLFNSVVVCKSDIKKICDALKTINNIKSSNAIKSREKKIFQYLEGNEIFSSQLENVLVDVYYFHYRFSTKQDQFNIGYVHSEITSQNPLYLLIISIAYSSFVGFLWLINHLSEQSRLLQNAMIGAEKLYTDISNDLKLFRIYCLQFINESSPIQIRLTGYYMNRLEDCWREFRLEQLSDQVNNQLQTLEQMFDWIENEKKETRNLKIGLAAISLALISLSAVTAQLISTIDFANTVDWILRIVLISFGFLVGILCSVLIYKIPKLKFNNFIKRTKNK